MTDNWQQHIAPPGSNLYYATLGLKPEEKNAIQAIFALSDAILSVPYECQEQSVALQKIAWWQQQLTKLPEGQVEHPIAKAIYTAQQRFPLPQPLLAELITAATQTLQKNNCLTESDYFVHCYYQAGISCLLSAHVLGFNDRLTVHFANHLGIVITTTLHLLHLRRHIDKQKIYFCEEHLDGFDLKAANFYAFEPKGKMLDFLNFITDYVMQHYDKALEKLPKAEKKNMRPLIVLARLLTLQLQEVKLDGYQLLTHTVELTPIRKLYYRWTSTFA